jgi:hypothetical protein
MTTSGGGDLDGRSSLSLNINNIDGIKSKAFNAAKKKHNAKLGSLAEGDEENFDDEDIDGNNQDGDGFASSIFKFRQNLSQEGSDTGMPTSTVEDSSFDPSYVPPSTSLAKGMRKTVRFQANLDSDKPVKRMSVLAHMMGTSVTTSTSRTSSSSSKQGRNRKNFGLKDGKFKKKNRGSGVGSNDDDDDINKDAKGEDDGHGNDQDNNQIDEDPDHHESSDGGTTSSTSTSSSASDNGDDDDDDDDDVGPRSGGRNKGNDDGDDDDDDDEDEERKRLNGLQSTRVFTEKRSLATLYKQQMRVRHAFMNEYNIIK